MTAETKYIDGVTFTTTGLSGAYTDIDMANTFQVGWEPPNVPALWAVV